MVLVVLTAGAASPPQATTSGLQSQKDDNTIKQQTAKYPIPAVPSSASTKPPHADTHASPRQETERHKQEEPSPELRAAIAAEDQADWAGKTFWLGVAGTVAVLLTLGATGWAAWAAHRSANAAHIAINADNRPWLDFDVKLYSGISWDTSGVVVDVEVTIKNFGSSPAVRVSVNPTLYPYIESDQDLINKMISMSEAVKEKPRVPAGTLHCVFPTSSVTDTYWAYATTSEIESYKADMVKTFGELAPNARLIFGYFLIVIVDYVMPGSEVVHFTRKTWFVRSREVAPIGASIKAEDVVLHRFSISDYAE